MDRISVKIKNYKCFRELSGFDEIKRINLIIGRNNVGKSALLDLVEAVALNKFSFPVNTWNSKTKPEILYSGIVTQSDITRVSLDNHVTTSSGAINYLEEGKIIIGSLVTWNANTGAPSMGLPQISYASSAGRSPDLVNLDNRLKHGVEPSIYFKPFHRLTAERDITPEISTADQLLIKSNGIGITNVIQQYLNSVELPREIVATEILAALNEIFYPDNKFIEITCRLHADGLWEIFLNEESKGLVPLSKSGSGLKTVLSVLAQIYLVPELNNNVGFPYVFAFEELENNIHPALLRRLVDFIDLRSQERNFTLFITTHSNVLIDMFSKREDAQIVHVTQKEGISSCSTVTTYIHNHGILDDLDIRASDLLQSNGIIWVEGPSDRIYLNRWISLWSDNKLLEGTHYQILFYGGRLLKHLNADVDASGEDGIFILNANRNAMVLIDSDIKKPGSDINNTKKRIKQEIEKLRGICWISQGREIENYIAPEIVDSFFELTGSSPVGQYDSFFNYLESLKSGAGRKYENKKPLLAENLAPLMTRELQEKCYDLDVKMNAVCDQIRRWNS